MEANAALLREPPAVSSSPPLLAGLDCGARKDQFQALHAAGCLEMLLQDRTSRQNIIWATDTYAGLGPGFARKDQILPELIAGRHEDLAAMRRQMRLERTRKHGEVCTPLAVCRMMCDCAHETLMREDWRQYVRSTVLEITCGEAPFLASRRDLGNGRFVPVPERVGILDRKLRIIGEKTASREEWLEWVYQAYQATYGYEFQGDNLLRARINLFRTFSEYMEFRWGAIPSEQENRRILEIISWNIWQMDGLTGTLPYGRISKSGQGELFGAKKGADETPACLIRDWEEGEVLTYRSLGK